MRLLNRRQPVVTDYHVEISPVCEVSLVGTADLEYWRQQLRPLGLFPTEQGGRAVVLLCGTDTRFKGVPFRELSISVFVSRTAAGTSRDGVYLVRAFNSVRFFAWVERTFFRTPYYPATIEVIGKPPLSLEVVRQRQTLLRVGMSAEVELPVAPLRTEDDGWEGPVFLPPRRRGPGKVFFARLRGRAEVYPFVSAEDVISLRTKPRDPIMQQLYDSGFAGHEWVLRRNATHAKSKTVSRPGGPLGW